MASRAAAALNDEEVHAEMRKMVAFISQEAMEKAREIRVKADEEFNIEKAKLVRSEAIHIENSFTKKVKQSSVQRKMYCVDEISRLLLNFFTLVVSQCTSTKRVFVSCNVVRNFWMSSLKKPPSNWLPYLTTRILMQDSSKN